MNNNYYLCVITKPFDRGLLNERVKAAMGNGIKPENLFYWNKSNGLVLVRRIPYAEFAELPYTPTSKENWLPILRVNTRKLKSKILFQAISGAALKGDQNGK